MSTRYRKGAAAGMNAFGRRRVEESKTHVSTMKKHLVSRRKVTKLYHRRQPKLATRVPTTHASGEVTSELEDADGEIEAPADSSDESDDDANEPRAYAPSGASRSSKFLKNRSSRLALKRSLSNNDVKHQAGRIGRKDRKKLRFLDQVAQQAQLEDFLEFAEYQEYQFELFSQNAHVAENAGINTTASAQVVDEGEDENSASDDEIYEQLEHIAESDDDDDDEVKLELFEEAAILEDVEKSGELGEDVTFDDGDSMFPQDFDSFAETPIIDHGGSMADSDFWEMARSETAPSVQQTPVVEHKSYFAGVTQSDLFTALNVSTTAVATNGSVVQSQTVVEDFGAFSDVDMNLTGLLTPSSLRRPLGIKCDDPDETDTDDDRFVQSHSISLAALRRKPAHTTPRRGSFNGVRKSPKSRTPKTGSWKISKKEIGMSHGKNGELITHERKRSSGVNTPHGIVPYDPKLPPPIDTSSIEFTGLEALPLQSPTLFSPIDDTQQSALSGITLFTSFQDISQNNNENMERFIHLP